MIYISKIIIPLITLIVIVYGLIKKINIYDEFLIGVKEGLQMSLEIFPSMFAMIISVTVLVKSNIINDLISLIDINLFPKEILPIAILRPISSSSSLITGSTDTTIYIIGMYYSSIKVTKIKHSLIVGLLADFSCVIISILVVYLL